MLRIASNALHHVIPQQPRNQGQRMPEYQPNRGNLLEFNNFRMVNVIELLSVVSKSQKSHKSHTYQRFQRFDFDVHVQC